MGAICEAASRPQMHFVSIKTIEQQSMLCIHRLREGFKQERTACTNRIGGLARLSLQRAQQQWAELDAHMKWCDERIAGHSKTNEQVRQAEQLIGVGPVTASAVVATVGDFKQFKMLPSLAPGWA